MICISKAKFIDSCSDFVSVHPNELLSSYETLIFVHSLLVNNAFIFEVLGCEQPLACLVRRYVEKTAIKTSDSYQKTRCSHTARIQLRTMHVADNGSSEYSRGTLS